MRAQPYQLARSLATSGLYPGNSGVHTGSSGDGMCPFLLTFLRGDIHAGKRDKAKSLSPSLPLSMLSTTSGTTPRFEWLELLWKPSWRWDVRVTHCWLSGRVSALKVHLLRKCGYVVTFKTSPQLSDLNLCCCHPGASGGSVQRCSLEVLFTVCLFVCLCDWVIDSLPICLCVLWNLVEPQLNWFNLLY